MEEETLACLWEIAQKVAGEDATLAERAAWSYCTCCDANGGGWGYDFQHASDCIVLKARALIKEQNPRSIEQERSIDTMGGKPATKPQKKPPMKGK